VSFLSLLALELTTFPWLPGEHSQELAQSHHTHGADDTGYAVYSGCNGGSDFAAPLHNKMGNLCRQFLAVTVGYGRIAQLAEMPERPLAGSNH
jgi:hypothetical protein